MTDTDTLREALEPLLVTFADDHRSYVREMVAEVYKALATLSRPEPAAVGERPAVPAKNGFLSFWYKNYRGELSERVAIPIRIYHGATEWHPEPQWLLEAWDMEKDAVRAFAMSDMQAPPPSSEAISPPDAPPECKECGRQLPNDCRVCAAIEAASASPPDARAVVEAQCLPESAVTQADRKAAAELIRSYWLGAGHEKMHQLADSIENGSSRHDTFSRAFAAHRIAALQSGASK